jgi:hypothetical protein
MGPPACLFQERRYSLWLSVTILSRSDGNHYVCSTATHPLCFMVSRQNMLRTTRREIERAYKMHLAACKTPASSSGKLLLLCYAVECGLKAVIMQLNNVQCSTELAEELQIGHDIREGLKRTHAPGSLTIRFTITQHGQSPQESVHPKQLHEAFVVFRVTP